MADGCCIDFEYNRIPHKVKEAYLNVMHSVRIADHLLEQVDDYASKNFDDETVSLHIRSWIDSTNHQKWLYSWDAYVQHLQKYKGRKVFLATDDPRLIKDVEEIASEAITRPPTDPKFDFFIEMLLLGRNNYFVGSPWIHTQMSWWLGGCKPNIDIAWRERLVSRTPIGTKKAPLRGALFY